MMGEIGDKIETTNIELEKLNTIGECKISIPSINSKKNQQRAKISNKL